MQTNTKIVAAGALLCLSAMAFSMYLTITAFDALKHWGLPQEKKEELKGMVVVRRAMYYGSIASTCLGCILILVGAFKQPNKE